MPTTHVLMVTDMSGSMNRTAAVVRSGFNEYVQDLVKPEKSMKFRVTSVLFNTDVVIHARNEDPANVHPLDVLNYQPRGMTALFDATGTALTNLKTILEPMKKRDKVFVVIQTDGLENASREWTLEALRGLIDSLEATGQWGFLFIGAGPDAWGNDFGSSVSGLRTQSSRESYRVSYDTLPEVSRKFSGGQSVAAVADFMEEKHREAGTHAESPQVSPEVLRKVDEALKHPERFKPRSRPRRKPPSTDPDDAA